MDHANRRIRRKSKSAATQTFLAAKYLSSGTAPVPHAPRIILHTAIGPSRLNRWPYVGVPSEFCIAALSPNRLVSEADRDYKGARARLCLLTSSLTCRGFPSYNGTFF